MTKYLLIVEDDVDIAELIVSAAGLENIKAHADHTVSAFKRSYLKQKPDIIVVDILMPDSDGIEALLWLSENKCDSSIIIASGFDANYLRMAKELAEAKGLKVVCVLSKPFSLEELRGALRK
jgi:DNA-binding response OmpR family regulator